MTWWENFVLYSVWVIVGICAVITTYLCRLAVLDHRTRVHLYVFQRYYRWILSFPAFYAIMSFLIVVSWKVDAVVEVLNTIVDVSEVVLVFAFAGVITELVGGPDRLQHIYTVQPIPIQCCHCCCCSRDGILGPSFAKVQRCLLWNFYILRPVCGGIALYAHLADEKGILQAANAVVMLITTGVFMPFGFLVLMSEQPDMDRETGQPWVCPFFAVRKKFLGFKLMVLLVVIQKNLFVMLANAGAINGWLVFEPDQRAVRLYCMFTALEMPFIAHFLRGVFPPQDAERVVAGTQVRRTAEGEEAPIRPDDGSATNIGYCATDGEFAVAVKRDSMAE